MFVRRLSILACLAVLVVLVLAMAPTGPAAAAGGATLLPNTASSAAKLQVAISGQFRDFTTGQAVRGARVTIVKQDGTPAGTAVADAAGDFSLTVESAAGAELTAVYEAAGYLREESVVRATEPALPLSPLLTPRGVKEAVLYSLAKPLAGSQPATVGVAGTATAPAVSRLAAAPTAISPLAAAALTPPATIRVYRNSLAVVQVVDFNFYCKHVLPNEWNLSWPIESVRAGAMAVKEYAWYYVNRGGKWPSLGADVKDTTADQVYDPNRSDSRADAAVDYAWSTYLLKNDALFMLQYCGDATLATLDATYHCTTHPTRMAEWGTYYLANDLGYDWQQIIHYYWDPVSIIGAPSGGVIRYDQTNANIVKTGTWNNFSNSAAYLGSYGRSSTAGAKATVWFTGTKIAWIGMKGTTPGIVDVYLDDVKQTTLDLYASPAQYQAPLWTSATLADGTHHMDLVRNSTSLSAEFIVLDAVDIWGNIIAAPSGGVIRYDQTNANIVKTGTWNNFSNSAAYLGSYGRSSTAGAKATVWFTGTKIAWIGMKGTTPGIVDVYLDDVKQTTLDLYASPAKYQVTLWTSATLADGTHHMDLVRNSTSLSAEFIVLDAVDIWGNIIAAP